MAGRKQHDTQTVISAVSSKGLFSLDLDVDLNLEPILPGGQKAIHIYAEKGYMYHVEQMIFALPIPTGGTTGKRLLALYPMNAWSGVLVEGAYNEVIRICHNLVIEGGAIQYPKDEVAMLNQIKGLKADENNSLRVYVENLTDANQDGTMTLKIVGMKERVA